MWYFRLYPNTKSWVQTKIPQGNIDLNTLHIQTKYSFFVTKQKEGKSNLHKRKLDAQQKDGDK